MRALPPRIAKRNTSSAWLEVVTKASAAAIHSFLIAAFVRLESVKSTINSATMDRLDLVEG